MAKKRTRKSIKGRHSKVSLELLGKIPKVPISCAELIKNLPAILAGQDFQNLLAEILEAKQKNRNIILGMGGHVIKTGVTPYLVQLMKNGFVKALALNGAALIHDFELAYNGRTSEDVEKELVLGEFGLAEETGQILNGLINKGQSCDEGLGETMVRSFLTASFPHQEYSLLYQAGLHSIPVTIHVAIGTDIIHMHPECDGAAVGQGTFLDFKRFCKFVTELEGGGGYLNLGSAVILPEVFLKALSLARNENPEFGNFFTANFDFIRHYRPSQSIIQRPLLLGARTYSLVGHHELMIPLLVAALLEMDVSH